MNACPAAMACLGLGVMYAPFRKVRVLTIGKSARTPSGSSGAAIRGEPGSARAADVGSAARAARDAAATTNWRRSRAMIPPGASQSVAGFEELEGWRSISHLQG